MSKTFIVSSKPVDQIPPDNQLRDVDREDLFKKYVMFGNEPVKIIGDDIQVITYFVATDIESFESMYLMNQALQVPLQRVVYANELWRDIMAIWKSKRRQIQAS